MHRILGRYLKNIHRCQGGQLLIMVLIMMVLGAFLITPLLAFMSTGLLVNRVYDDKTEVLYAADAGIEDATWKIQYDRLTGFSPYNFSDSFTYEIAEGEENDENINQYPVEVNIWNHWVLSDMTGPIPPPTESEASEIVYSNRLAVVGSTIETGIPAIGSSGQSVEISQYRIKVIYTRWEEGLADLKINRIGIWLPGGFTYFSDPDQDFEGESIRSQLEGLSGDHQSIPYSQPSNGNEMIIWDFADPPSFNSFPPSVLSQTSNVLTLEFTFFFQSPGQPGARPDAVAWVETSGVDEISYAWNADVKVYRVQSTAEDTTVEAYLTKSELRAMSSAVAGDYFATGNTLMRNANSDSGHIRDTWLNPDHSSSALVEAADVGEIEATEDDPGTPVEIAAAYLYWTGWKSAESLYTIFSDNGSDLDEWQTSSSESQTRVPTGEGDTGGIWNTSPCWDDVDEIDTGINDADYMTGLGGGGNTGWLNPTASTADSGGDNNGFESNPDRAHIDGGGNAANNNGGGDRHRYYGYDTGGIPAGSTITGIEVRLDWWVDSTWYSTSSMGVELSWDGGATWTSARTDNDDSTYSSNSVVLGSPSDRWGHTWSTEHLDSSNFRVRLTCISSSSSRDFYLDWVPVRITYSSSSVDQKLFTFTPFSIPAGMPVDGLTVYYRARDNTIGYNNNIRAAVKVGDDVYYNSDTGNDPGSRWRTYLYTFAVNPATGSPWTPEDINGTGPNPLRQFGVYSSDLDPGVQVSAVYARVDYGYASLWSVASEEFRGRGSSSANDAQRILTLRNSLDLSAYAPDTVSISWNQIESGTLEPGDALLYAFSNDNGNSWSDYYEAFNDDNPAGTFGIVIPELYRDTGYFKIRFYLSFNDSDEYAYLDNISIVITELFNDNCSDYDNWDRSFNSRWSIDSGRFRGTGSSSATTDQRTLTMSDGIDLSHFDPGTVWICWQQSAAGLDPDDMLFFAFDSDNTNWSSNIDAFRGSDTNTYFGWQVPDEYLDTGFRVRFYMGFNDSNDSVRLDNISLNIMTPDRSVYFMIDGQQVYFDGSAPAAGSEEVIASSAEIIPSITSGTFNGYSYSCFKDVTALVRKYTTVDAGEATQHSPGIAEYTVGHVDATLGIDGGDYQLAHAGWSLILVYTSRETVGHQIYLFDRFTYADDYTDLDFDRDGRPGGDISGFIVPERVEMDGVFEENVAKMTVFVGEGDAWIGDDFIAFQAPEEYWDGTFDPEDIPDDYKLWDGINVYSEPDSDDERNNSGRPQNVWNGQSTVFAADGIDIDTFHIPWDSGLLEQGDTTAHIDFYT
ncbi:MAG: hypothetical protein PHU23_09750, partial [Dehalococcoidales bacterium]|nr:hypothetical protein [Dehalococcoidales bacterium]